MPNTLGRCAESGGLAVTDAESQGKRDLRVWAVVLLLVWAVAGALNAGEFIMGGTPTARGVAATLLAICVWPVAGWFAGSRSWAGFIRLVTAFWITVVVGIPLAFWAAKATEGTAFGGVGLVPLSALFALAAPLYGLSALLPPWESILQGATTGAAGFAVTMFAYLLRRRIGSRSAQAGPG